MDKQQTKFEEQHAPLKNTDKAFVQVSKDGSPAMPQVSKEEKKEEPSRGGTTNIERR